MRRLLDREVICLAQRFIAKVVQAGACKEQGSLAGRNLSAGLIQSTPTGYRLGFSHDLARTCQACLLKEEVIKYVSRFLEQLGGLDIHVSSVSYCLVNVEPAGLDALPPSHDRSCVEVSMKSEVVCCSSSAHAVGGDKLVFQLKRLYQRVQVAPE